jgi:hypothetical protein
MSADPLYEYILLQTPRRPRAVMMSQFTPGVYDPDPFDRHYDTRRTWLAWPDPAPPPVPLRQRLGQALVRFGAWLEGHDAMPAPRTDSATT